MTTGLSEIPAQAIAVQGEEMLQPDEVAAMVRLHELGWGAKRLSKEFGCARNTVRRYLRAGGVVPFACRATIRVRRRDNQDENPVCQDRRRA